MLYVISVTKIINHTVIRCLTVPFKSFVVYSYCTLMLLQKCFIFKNRKVMEAVITIPHQDNGCVRIAGHTYSKQGAVLPLGPLDQASRDFHSLTGRVDAPTQPGSSYRRQTVVPLLSIRMGSKSLRSELGRGLAQPLEERHGPRTCHKLTRTI